MSSKRLQRCVFLVSKNRDGQIMMRLHDRNLNRQGSAQDDPVEDKKRPGKPGRRRRSF
jgi:hypothetical protein